jgi:subtilisin family serine protease
MIPWLAAAALAAPASFYPGRGAARLDLDPDGRVHGMARTGDVLVHTTDPAALAALPEVAEVHLHKGGVARVVPAKGVDDVALSVALHDRPDVDWAHPNLYVTIKAESLPDDPYLPAQWHLQNTGQLGYNPGVDIHAADAWEITHGAGQLIAIIDEGVDLAQPDLRVTDGHDYVDDDESSQAVGDGAHGTACAGLAAAIGNNDLGTAGVAYEADVYAIRIIGATTLAETYDAFVEATDAGATVLSNSWGFVTDDCSVSDYGVVSQAVQYAEENGRGGLGSAVVFAAGNEDCDIENNAMLADPLVITVAAMNGFDVRESYSNYGASVDIAAPSGNMTTTDIVGSAGYNGYPGDNDYTNWFNGTSASTPVVSGVVALMFAANDRLTAAGARDALCDTAIKMDLEAGEWDDTGRSPYYGCGRVDAAAAVRAVANLGPPQIPASLAEEIPPDAAVLSWTDGADPDHDHVNYTIRWAFSTKPWPRTQVATDRTFADLTGQVADGDEIVWQVKAADQWGETEWSADQLTEVVAPPVAEVKAPEEQGGCDHSPVSPVWSGLLAGLAALASRRRVS